VAINQEIFSLQSGWIALPREVINCWLWNDDRRFKMWLYLVINAKWQESIIYINGNTITLKRGQLAVSTRELMNKWGCSCEMATSFLRRLESSGLITRENCKRFSIVTIVNYDIFQPMNECQTLPKPKRNIQPKAVRQMTQNKERDKEIKKNISSMFSTENEEKFFNETIENNEIIKSLSIVFKLSEKDIKDEIYVFLHDVRLIQHAHKDAHDFVTHFKYWFAKQIKGRGGAAPKKTNYDISKQQQQQFRDKRGTEISNRTNRSYKNDAF
jgi:hypothetical protein